MLVSRSIKLVPLARLAAEDLTMDPRRTRRASDSRQSSEAEEEEEEVVGGVEEEGGASAGEGREEPWEEVVVEAMGAVEAWRGGWAWA